MRRCRLFCAVLAMVVSGVVTSAHADRVYKWRDAAGVVHFSDTPPMGRGAEAQTIEPLATVQTKEAGEASAGIVSLGRRLWRERCEKCHSLGEKREEGKIGLARIIRDPDTSYAKPLEVLLRDLRYAVDGFTSDMDRVDVSDEELEAIAQFLRSNFLPR